MRRCLSARETPPPKCGWSEKTLIVRSSEPDEDRPPFEEHYRISEDGQRLIEEVDFRGRPFQRLHDVARMGSLGRNKKAGLVPGFQVPMPLVMLY